MIGILAIAFDETFASPDELMSKIHEIAALPGVHAELWFPYQAEMLAAQADADAVPIAGVDEIPQDEAPAPTPLPNRAARRKRPVKTVEAL